MASCAFISSILCFSITPSFLVVLARFELQFWNPASLSNVGWSYTDNPLVGEDPTFPGDATVF
jgi:hypothetical protein